MIRYRERWAVVTGASSGLGQLIATRLAERGMFLLLTGRNAERLSATAELIRGRDPGARVETIVADLSTVAGVSTLLAQVGDRPVEVLINNAGFGSYGRFVESDLAREIDEVAVDVSAVLRLARAFLPGMVARGSGGILNVASTIAFQPGPYQAVYGACKAFVLSFSQALWAEARPAGVAVTALCPGPTRTGFVAALDADVGHTAIYSTLAEPEPVVDAGLRALDEGRAVVIPGAQNWLLAKVGRALPFEWITRISARLLRPDGVSAPPPIDVWSEKVIAAPAERVWDLLADVERWPSWYRACRWVRVIEYASGEGGAQAFEWKAYPVELRSTVVRSDRPRSFVFDAVARGLYALHAISLEAAPDGASTRVVSHEIQRGWLPWLGRPIIARQLRSSHEAWLDDLARAAGEATAASHPLSTNQYHRAMGDLHRAS